MVLSSLSLVGDYCRSALSRRSMLRFASLTAASLPDANVSRADCVSKGLQPSYCFQPIRRDIWVNRVFVASKIRPEPSSLGSCARVLGVKRKFTLSNATEGHGPCRGRSRNHGARHGRTRRLDCLRPIALYRSRSLVACSKSASPATFTAMRRASWKVSAFAA
jgi:hypothetical protein